MRVSLLDEIEADSLDGSRPLSDALRKCVALGSKANSDQLRAWASKELNGYGPDDELPDYRRIGAPILIDGRTFDAVATGQRISALELPMAAREHVSESVALVHPIATLEQEAKRAFAKDEGVKLSPPHAAEIVALMNRYSQEDFQAITELYWRVSGSTLMGVVDRVRTTLVELVAELRAGMDDSATVPSAEVASNAVNVAAYGRSRVTLTAQQATAGGDVSVAAVSPDSGAGRWRFWAKVAGFFVGLATLGSALVSLIQSD